MTRARAEGPFSVELDSWPLVRFRSPSANEYESVDIASFFWCVELALARNAPFVLLHDARDMSYVDEQRQLVFLVELDRIRAQVERNVVAYAALTRSPLERGLITALFWASKVSFPTRMFTAELEARAFLLERYQRKMLPDASPPLA